MHHDVATVATLLAGVRVGRPRLHSSGLTVVPLEDVDGGLHAGLREARGQPAVGETTPPRAGELIVANRGPGAITLHQGDLFTGGLADRAALAALVVGAGEERVLPVEPTEPRWWWTGPPVLAGTLDPPLSALLALAGLDGAAGGGLSASARSCLWTIVPRGAAAVDDESVAASRGWVLHSGATVLAARVWDGPRSPTAERLEPAASLDPSGAVARRFLAALARAPWPITVAGEGAVEIRGHHAVATFHDGRIVELGTVRPSEELVDALLSRA